MMVWILERMVPHDMWEVLGVFSSRGRAVAAAREAASQNREHIVEDWYRYVVRPCKLDDQPDTPETFTARGLGVTAASDPSSPEASPE